jgi:hypothetical protein
MSDLDRHIDNIERGIRVNPEKLLGDLRELRQRRASERRHHHETELARLKQRAAPRFYTHLP